MSSKAFPLQEHRKRLHTRKKTSTSILENEATINLGEVINKYHRIPLNETLKTPCAIRYLPLEKKRQNNLLTEWKQKKRPPATKQDE